MKNKSGANRAREGVVKRGKDEREGEGEGERRERRGRQREG